MPWSTPTLADQRQRARAFFAGRFPAAAALLQNQRPSALGVAADEAAGLSQGELEYLRWQVNAVLMPDTCERPYLLRRAKQYRLAPLPPVAASGPVLVSGNAGADLPAGSLVSSDTNAVFFTVLDAIIPPDGSPQAVAVVAQQGSAGSAGNLFAGTSLGLVTAVPGINASVIVQAPGLTGGVDTESDDAFRARFLARIRQPPEGGAAADYITWVRQSGIGATRIFVLPLNRGPGTCDVSFMLDGRVAAIPSVSEIAAVQAYIDVQRPVTGDCVVFAPSPDLFAVTISSLTISPGSTMAVVRAAINAAVGDMLRRDATVPGAYGVANPGVERLSRLVAAIQGTPGVVYFELVSPTADVVHANGHIAIAPPVVFQ